MSASPRSLHWLLTDFGQSCTLLMEIGFAFIALCEFSGIYRPTVKLMECQRDGMTGGGMPEHNTCHDGPIIRLILGSNMVFHALTFARFRWRC